LLNDIHTLSLHDALPISSPLHRGHRMKCCIFLRRSDAREVAPEGPFHATNGPNRTQCGKLPNYRTRYPCAKHALDGINASAVGSDRKSTRLNSSHVSISY